MSRAALHRHVELITGVPTYATNSVSSPDEDRFVVINWMEKVKSFGTRGPSSVAIWLFDRNQDYAWIDSKINELVESFHEFVHVPGEDGIITQVDWVLTSGDLWDDGYKRITKYLQCQVVARIQ